MSTPFVVPPGEGRLLDLGTFEAEVIAEGARTEESFSLIHTRREPPGFGPPLHRHQDAAEAFYVLEGTYLVYTDDRQDLCPPGSFVYVPRRVPHTFTVVSEGAGRKLNLFAPAAMVGFFEELSRAQAHGEATPDLLDRIAGAHDMEVLGPVPDSYL
ncbi:cupin domain-containing protein [Modestobacter excelsi]|uniref:cupin domain-containing protein n=1 Tax=Modestobacter excelsi TaxID=2213161 RepID=UPI00110CC745|nr:cupin domain-containing protein [Modestobacter excelsi]